MDYTTASWRIREWFPKLSEDVLHDLRLFHVELLRFNDKINLISVKTIADADLHHFADALMAGILSKPLYKGKRVYDVGSGNGFPGLVMAILDRETEFMLIDSDLRKVEFLKYMVSALKLKKVGTAWTRIEALDKEEIEFGISRAFAPIPRALMLTRKAFKKGAKYIHMKSEEWPIEVASIPPQLCSTWNTQFLHDYTLPMADIRLSLLMSEKIR